MPIIVASLHLIAIFVLWMWRNPEGDDGFGNWAFLATLALYQTQLVLLTSWMMLRRYSFDSPALEPREPWIDNAAGLGGPLYGLTAGVMLALEESQHIEGFLIAFITFTIVVAAAPLLIVSLPLMIARQFGWRWTNSPLRGPPIRFSLGQFFMATVIVAVGFAYISPMMSDPAPSFGVIRFWAASLASAGLGLAVCVGPRLHIGPSLVALVVAAVMAFGVVTMTPADSLERRLEIGITSASPAALMILTLLALRLGGWRIDRPAQ